MKILEEVFEFFSDYPLPSGIATIIIIILLFIAAIQILLLIPSIAYIRKAKRP